MAAKRLFLKMWIFLQILFLSLYVLGQTVVPRSYEDVKVTRQDNHKLLPNETECGPDGNSNLRNLVTPYVINGQPTSLDQYPWTVLIKYINEDDEELFLCGGSLINDRYVLTAAHCVNNMIVAVRLGEWDLDSDPDCVVKDRVRHCADPVVEVGIERILMHKNYTRRLSSGGKIDMALLRLDRAVRFGRFVAPICLPGSSEEGELANGQMMFLAGWGTTEHGDVSRRKLYVDVHNVDLEECRKLVNAPVIKIDETLICALGQDGKDSCQGDSGGPLMERRSLEDGSVGYMLRGIISNGLSCGSTKPGFYTNVFKQMDWIVSNLEP